MKKVLLLIVIAMCGHTTFAQMSVFMKMIENKMICNKEDQFTYFLQSNSYERRNENHYYHYYMEKGEAYYITIINENDCYAIYRTDNAKDYNRIKTAITTACVKEYAKDKSVSYICNNRRVQDVQIIFDGYSKDGGYYDIKVFQNPATHELPYNQSDRSTSAYNN